ncbi:MAG: NTP transferase domain-containing protein [Candidatus Cloacimonetes bacterium]|nr:NTP transferase domain-containing protein [Candidatus Cloacimonadota bacterium]
MKKREIESVILAAGRSRRMGKDKAMLKFGAHYAIDIILDKIAGISSCTVIVLGQNYAMLTRHLTSFSTGQTTLRFCYNKDHHLGMFSSIQAGIGLCTGMNPILLQMIDQPLIPLQVYDSLINGIDRDHLIIQPVNFDKRPGHPLLFTPEFREIILAEQPVSNLRNLIRRYQCRRRLIQVETKLIYSNFNTPEDLLKNKGEQQYGNFSK